MHRFSVVKTRQAKVRVFVLLAVFYFNMAATEDADLLAYSDGEEGATAAPVAAAKPKGNYASVHSSTFKDFLLKDELLHAIADCGFEHPSEGYFGPTYLMDGSPA